MECLTFVNVDHEVYCGAGLMDRTPIFASAMSAFEDIAFYDEDKALSITKLLIEANADVNAADSNAITPLVFVALVGYSTVAEAMNAAPWASSPSNCSTIKKPSRISASI